MMKLVSILLVFAAVWYMAIAWPEDLTYNEPMEMYQGMSLN